jgi:hypothetical protein
VNLNSTGVKKARSSEDLFPSFFFSVVLLPNAGHGNLIPEVYGTHKTMHHIR